MGFDEAIKKAKEDSFVEEMLSDVVDLEDVIELLENLKKEYAPTVEMTQAQKDVFLFYKKMTWFSLFISKLNEENNMVFATLPDVSCFGKWGVSKEREIELMQAWLHLETIKVVGENDE